MDDNMQNVWEKYPAALPKGSILAGQYIIQNVLGQGGFGITYLAEDIQLKINVAVKEFFPESLVMRQSETPTVTAYSGGRLENFSYGIQSFLEEARVLAQFQGDPNIVGVRSYFEENGTAYFVMDYVEGINFKTYIQEHGGRLSWDEAWEILSPVMDALSTVHRKGVIHRDVTPDNILIASDHTVKLLDFGAARYNVGDRSQSMDVVLKAGYAPKEQYTRKGRQGPYTDVYSVAACFYAALCGYLPPESLDRMEEDDLVPLSTRGVKLPEDAEKAILIGLEVNPADRFQTMETFKYALMGGTDQTQQKERQYGQVVNTNISKTVPEESSAVAPAFTESRQQEPGQAQSFMHKYRVALVGMAAVVFIAIIGVWLVGSGRIGLGKEESAPTDGHGLADGTKDEDSSIDFVAVGEPLSGKENTLPETASEDEKYCAEYLTAVLDAFCKNEPSAFVNMGIGTAEEAGDFCEDVAEDCTAALLTEYVKTSEDGYLAVKEAFREMFSRAQYTVKSAERQADGSYEVAVAYSQMLFFEPLRDYCEAYMMYYVDEFWPEDLDGAPSGYELDSLMLTFLAESMQGVLEDVRYTELKETTITIVKSGDEFILEENEGKVGAFILDLFDLEHSGGIGVSYDEDSEEYFIGVWEEETGNRCGLYCWANGDQCIGRWKDGQRNGVGYYCWADGGKYLGDYMNDQRNGEGALLWADGSLSDGSIYYSGDWVNDKREGHGICLYEDGKQYEGDWVNDEREGYGICLYEDGSQYEGEWANGMWNGEGEQTLEDGTKYVGVLKDGEWVEWVVE